MTRHSLFSTLATLLCASALFVVGCRTGSTTAVPTDRSKEGIIVDAQGEATGAPDIAKIELGVQARARDAATATRQVSKTMTAVLAAVNGAGVADKDVQTRNLSIHEEHHYEPPPRPMPATEPVEPGGEPEGSEKRSFVATNMVSLTVRDLDQLSAVIGAATNAGANQMHGITLELDDPTELESKARDEAFAKARAKAEHLAKLSGVELGELVAVQLSSDGGYHPYPMAMAKTRDAAEESMPVQRGEITVRQRIQLQYALKQ